MGKNILILAVIIIAAYLVGVESAKARGKNYEDLRHQLERLWMSADAKKSRKRLGKRLQRLTARARDAVFGG